MRVARGRPGAQHPALAVPFIALRPWATLGSWPWLLPSPSSSNLFSYLLILRKKIGRIDGTRIARSLLVAAVASLVMGAAVHWTAGATAAWFQTLPAGDLWHVLLCVATGVAVGPRLDAEAPNCGWSSRRSPAGAGLLSGAGAGRKARAWGLRRGHRGGGRQRLHGSPVHLVQGQSHRVRQELGRRQGVFLPVEVVAHLEEDHMGCKSWL